RLFHARDDSIGTESGKRQPTIAVGISRFCSARFSNAAKQCGLQHELLSTRRSAQRQARCDSVATLSNSDVQGKVVPDLDLTNETSELSWKPSAFKSSRKFAAFTGFPDCDFVW